MNLISFALLSLLLALSPGPDNLYVLSQSMVHGFKTGLWITLGLILGCLIHTTLLAFGFSVLIDKWPDILIVFRLFGGGYLWYLAYRMIRSSPQLGIDQAGVLSHPWKWFQKGFILNVSNPKVFLFFVALFPTFLWGGQEDTVLQFYALGAIFMTATAVVFAGIAFLAATLGHFLATKSKFWLRFHYFQIALFIGLAIYIFLP